MRPRSRSEVPARTEQSDALSKALSKLGVQVVPGISVPALPRVTEQFDTRLAACPDEDLSYLLDQYANPVRNQAALVAPEHVNGKARPT